MASDCMEVDVCEQDSSDKAVSRPMQQQQQQQRPMHSSVPRETLVPRPYVAADAAAAAAAAAVDRAKVTRMLDALAAQQPLFMNSKYVKICDLNR